MAQLPQLDLDQILLEAERKVVALALNRCRQNRTRAAAMLGIQRTRLLRRLEVLGLSCNQQPIDEDHTEPQSTTGSAEPVDEDAE